MSLSSKKSGANRDKEEKKLCTEMVQISNTIKRLDKAIIVNEKDKVLTPNKAKQLAKLNDELEVQKNLELQKLQETENLLSGLRNDDVWVDWVKDYGKKVKNLDKLDRDARNARNAEILKYIDKILVSFNEDKRTHNLNIKLKLPIIDDTLKYEGKDKKKGYKLGDGSDVAAVDIQSHTKKLGKR